MTLILGFHVNGHAIQVSDRLVSLNTEPPRRVVRTCSEDARWEF